MQLFPAIDLKEGCCVRLTQGDFASATHYESDPMAQAEKFAAAGAEWIHIVDLDRARGMGRGNFETIATIARRSAVKLQVGGGIRNDAEIDELIDCGAERVIVGSVAVENPDIASRWLERFTPRRLVFAFDVRADGGCEPRVLKHGWRRDGAKGLWEVLDAYAESGLSTILCTDVARDGMLAGPNVELYNELRAHSPRLNVLASGGVGTFDDLLQLVKTGVSGAVVGKALYEGRIDLAQAIAEMKRAG